MERKLGREAAARAAYDEALEVFRRSKDRGGEADVRCELGVWESNRNPQLAKQHFLAAADLYASIGDTRREKRVRERADRL